MPYEYALCPCLCLGVEIRRKIKKRVRKKRNKWGHSGRSTTGNLKSAGKDKLSTRITTVYVGLITFCWASVLSSLAARIRGAIDIMI